MIYLTLFVHSLLFNQTLTFDEIRIYIHPEYLTYGITDECVYNDNWTRVNSTIKISILEKNKISDIQKLFLASDLKVSNNARLDRPQMVVDYISKGRINHSISISTNELFKIDDDQNVQYFLDFNQKEFYQKYLKFFRE